MAVPSLKFINCKSSGNQLLIDLCVNDTRVSFTAPYPGDRFASIKEQVIPIKEVSESANSAKSNTPDLIRSRAAPTAIDRV